MIALLKFLGVLLSLLIGCAGLIASAPEMARVVIGLLVLAAAFAGKLPVQQLKSARAASPGRFRIAQVITSLLLLFLWGGSMVESQQEQTRLQLDHAEELIESDPVGAYRMAAALEFHESDVDEAARARTITERTLDTYRGHLADKAVQSYNAHDMDAGAAAEGELSELDGQAPELERVEKSRTTAKMAMAAEALAAKIKQLRDIHQKAQAHLDKKELPAASALIEQAGGIIADLGDGDKITATRQSHEALLAALNAQQVSQNLDRVVIAQEAADKLLKDQALEAADKHLQEAQALLDAFPAGTDIGNAQKKQARLAKAIRPALAKLRLATIQEESEPWIESADIAEKGADDMVAMKEYGEADTLYADAIRYFREIPEEHRRLLKLDSRLAGVEARRASNTARVQQQKKEALAAKAQRRALVEKCGTKPIWAGTRDRFSPAEYYLKDKVHDPNGLEVFNCGDAHLDPNRCWLLTCQVRARNGYGALRLQRMRFAYMKFTVFLAEAVR